MLLIVKFAMIMITAMKRILLAALAAVAVLAGCNKIERVGRNSSSGTSGQGSGQQTDFDLAFNSSWSVEYSGREYGATGTADIISVSGVPSNLKYLVSVINRENYASYEGDLKAFMRQERKDAADDYIYSGGSRNISFDVFRHGTWYAFVMGLDATGNLTGEYTYSKFEVSEEVPTEEYKKWLGSWKVKAPGLGFDYTLTITQQEANYVYRVDGWECYPKDRESYWKGEGFVMMDQEYLETFYDSGDMYFTSQYIQTYKETNGTNVDEIFLGEVDYDGILHPQGLYVLYDEGFDLAKAAFGNDGGTATLSPCRVIAVIEGEDFPTSFYQMRYFAIGGGETTYYNEKVPVFPIQMERSSQASQTSAVRLRSGLESRSPMRGRLFRPRTGQPQRASVRLR